MTTPGGLLRWGQAGRYSAFDDRVVITALAGGRTGIVRAARMSPGLGLAVVVAGGWAAIGDCGDGTSAVLSGTVPVQVQAQPGDGTNRTDELVADIVDPETARWSLSIVPAGTRLGVVLGWVHVPADAASAADMRLESREQDFSTGGAVPGPPGPVGPGGPEGPPGQATLIVGSFSRNPADLPENGYIPADWDRPGNPASDVQIQQGWALIHEPTGDLWQYLGADFHGAAAAWLKLGLIQGPPGPAGPQGPQGPPGEATASYQSDAGFFTMGNVFGNGNEIPITRAWVIPRAQLIPGSWFEVETNGSGTVAGTNIRVAHRINGGLENGVIEMALVNNANPNTIAARARAVYQITTPDQMIAWTELVTSPRTPPNASFQSNATGSAISNVDYVAIPAGDLTIGLAGRWQQTSVNQNVVWRGSRLSRYIGTPVTASEDPPGAQQPMRGKRQ